MQVNEVPDQVSMAGQPQTEAHGNDEASTSKQKPEATKFESGKLFVYLSWHH